MSSSAQTSTAYYDSLLINTWRFKSFEIDKKPILLTEAQKQGRFILNKNHTSKQLFDGMAEKGRWRINNETIEVTSDILPDEVVFYKILTLTADTLVLEIANEESGQRMKFSLFKEVSE